MVLWHIEHIARTPRGTHEASVHCRIPSHATAPSHTTYTHRLQGELAHTGIHHTHTPLRQNTDVDPALTRHTGNSQKTHTPHIANLHHTHMNAYNHPVNTRRAPKQPTPHKCHGPDSRWTNGAQASQGYIENCPKFKTLRNTHTGKHIPTHTMPAKQTIHTTHPSKTIHCRHTAFTTISSISMLQSHPRNTPYILHL